MSVPFISSAIARPKFKWDGAAKAGYLTLAKAEVMATKEVEPGIMIDYDLLGNIVGIEVLR